MKYEGTPSSAFSHHNLPVAGVGLARIEFIISEYIKVIHIKHCIVLHCIVLYCIALHCMKLEKYYFYIYFKCICNIIVYSTINIL